MQQPDPPAPAPTEPWWKGAVIYQIYPRSFADSNGDGIGDLPGITRHLEYVASLGVDAIWLSPFFTSPMKDFGYDVADYQDVDPIFGTLADFDALVSRAHALGLKVVIDQVYCHTSDLHPWFVESRSSRTNPKADWYVWADAKPDGSPPSNWQSVFGGPAWTWDARRRQYYMHNFLREQPQINGHLAEVQQALLATSRFWLDRGVDGFRLDALNFMMYEPALTDNPPAPLTDKPPTRPFDYQIRRYNQGHPDITGFLEQIRATMDDYPDRFTVAEVGGEDAEREMKLFTEGDRRLDTAYGFAFLYASGLTPEFVDATLTGWPDAPGVGWPSWAFENHDAPRAITRWAPPAGYEQAFAACKMALLMCLRGNVFLYYGEELGLTQVDVAFADLQDPEAIANWPLTLSRDGARTPMPWLEDEPHAGFSTARPWLPLGADHLTLAVDEQERNPASLLHLTRRLLALRRSHPSLSTGTWSTIHVGPALLAFEREVAGECLLCVFNLGIDRIEWHPAEPDAWRVLAAVNGAADWTLDAYGALIAQRYR